MENVNQVKIDETNISSSLRIPYKNEMDEVGLKVLRQMQMDSSLNGNSEMTLEEINAEIAAVRKEKKIKIRLQHEIKIVITKEMLKHVWKENFRNRV